MSEEEGGERKEKRKKESRPRSPIVNIEVERRDG